MKSSSNLNTNVVNLAQKQEYLHRIIRSADKASAIPAINPLKLFPAWREMRSSLNWRELVYPFAAILALLTAVCALLIPPLLPKWPILWISLIGYVGALLALRLTRESFAQAYIKKRLGTENVSTYAFGINNISLVIQEIFRQLRSGNDSVRRTSITSDELKRLIEINKATHDYSWANHSKVSVGQKMAGFAVPAISLLVNHLGVVERYWQPIRNAFEHSHTKALEILAYSVLIAFSIFVWLFSGPIIDARRIKSQKRFVLILTILHQNWE